ncbi:MAG: SsrA-binding protein SmpB [Chloroflexi bacterium]|nr:SsrA-binding protein SmpB [Chloroflexota bacterium]
MAQKTEQKKDDFKVVSVNRKALHDYDVLERVEAGVVLTGSEIKSIRGGRANLSDAYARPDRGELWLLGAHIAQYEKASYYNHEPTRSRKLLLHKDQLFRLVQTVQQKGLTLIPLRLYIRNHVAKVELGVCRGRREYDKRRILAERATEREIQRALRQR